MRRTASRRDFARTCFAASGAVLGMPALVRGQHLNNKLNVAVIGVGGRGGASLGAVAKTENVTVLCDVNTRAMDGAGVKHPQARKIADLRRVFDHAREFDAVTVSTCEHTHALPTLLALQHGKHVYCEKPLTWNIEEARRVREAAAKAKVATQMGIQIHSGDNYRRVVELIQAGAIGPVREAHVWVGRTWGRQSPEDARKFGDIVSVQERPVEEHPVPAGLDWDLWIGPAPMRPFHSVYYPGPKWYRWWDFGNGTMSDLGSHWNDLPFWALKLRAPLTVEAFGPPPHPEIAPASMRAVYEYGARGDLPAVKLHWYQGQEKPAILAERKLPAWGSGVLFVGDQGLLFSDYGKHQLLPEADFAGYVRPEPKFPKSPGQHEEWLAEIKGGPKALADFEYSGWLTEANHLGNVAYRVGKKLHWDADAMKATNAPEAEPFIRRIPRQGWEWPVG
jgi:predicted dehydrogenase